MDNYGQKVLHMSVRSVLIGGSLAAECVRFVLYPTVAIIRRCAPAVCV
mgnify:FL=1